jgi:N-acetylmuramic acid 6-phosphate etherase
MKLAEFDSERGDELKVDLSALITEQVNQKSKNLDELSTVEILRLMNDEDRTVADVVREVIPQIEHAIESIHGVLLNGGRLFYIGAGSSGRLGVLDASECPPTFQTPPELVQSVMAGGAGAIFAAVEGAEDNPELAVKDLQDRQLTSQDAVVGISASGRTPYVVGALSYAKQVGAVTVALACNEGSLIGSIAEHRIEVVVGPEILMGSTRLKAATAQKLVLNMISTTSMVKLGKVYQNLMVDLNANNQKLIDRARRIVMMVTGKTYAAAKKVLDRTGQKVKPAIVMIEADVTYEIAMEVISTSEGYVRQAIELAASKHTGGITKPRGIYENR